MTYFINVKRMKILTQNTEIEKENGNSPCRLTALGFEKRSRREIM